MGIFFILILIAFFKENYFFFMSERGKMEKNFFGLFIIDLYNNNFN